MIEQTTVEMHTLSVITVLLFLGGIIILSLLCMLAIYNKIDFNFWLGMALAYIISLFGFFGFFYAKEKEERRKFILGWILSFTLKLIYWVAIILIIII